MQSWHSDHNSVDKAPCPVGWGHVHGRCTPFGQGLMTHTQHLHLSIRRRIGRQRRDRTPLILRYIVHVVGWICNMDFQADFARLWQSACDSSDISFPHTGVASYPRTYDLRGRRCIRSRCGAWMNTKQYASILEPEFGSVTKGHLCLLRRTAEIER